MKRARALITWSGWWSELAGLIAAWFVVYVVDARWWWKAALIFGIVVAQAVVVGVVQGFRKGRAS